jgi:DNA invertase Pin-like site-specific DNA recombinase
MGKFFLTLLGAFAEMERQLISERTMNGKISSITEK